MAKVDAGFDEAFRRQLIPLVPKLRAFARTLARHDQDGEDLAQTAVMKAWRSRRAFELGTDLTRWLYRILRNEHISGVRAARRRGPHVPDGAERVIGPDDPHLSLECAELLRAIRDLPLAAREALILVGAGGMTYDEAAAIVGCPVGTVKTRVFRARLALAARFAVEPPAYESVELRPPVG